MTEPSSNDGQPKRMLLVRYPVEQVLPAPEPANFFHFAQLGGDIQLSVGVIDPALAANLSSADEPIAPTIVRRFFLSVTSLRVLQRQVEDIIKKGNIPPLDPDALGEIPE